MAQLIEAVNLSRFYGRRCAVNDISFGLSKGQVLGFLGVNGAGKTTTMQMLSGNLAPSSGTVRINGFDLQSQAKQAKHELGYLPDVPPLYKELTVQEFLAYCARLHGLPKHAVPKAIAYVQERCGLPGIGKRLIGNLSKGYQQRVGIAQAILHNPKVIILDEPTVGLDPLQIREIRTLIRELGQDHGVILSTHILAEVAESCSHVQIIHQGRLVLNDSIAGLKHMMGTGILQVSTRLPADVAVLAAIPGVNSVETITNQQIKIHFSTADNPSQRITGAIIAAGWELLELTPVQTSIEDIFINLTQGRPS